MDYPKFIVSNQKEESISIQKIKLPIHMRFWYLSHMHKRLQ